MLKVCHGKSIEFKRKMSSSEARSVPKPGSFAAKCRPPKKYFRCIYILTLSYLTFILCAYREMHPLYGSFLFFEKHFTCVHTHANEQTYLNRNMNTHTSMSFFFYVHVNTDIRQYYDNALNSEARELAFSTFTNQLSGILQV